jgi:hypothetical protein
MHIITYLLVINIYLKCFLKRCYELSEMHYIFVSNSVRTKKRKLTASLHFCCNFHRTLLVLSLLILYPPYLLIP